MLTNPKTWGPFTEVAEISGFDHAVSLSWSQGGEDLALIFSLGDGKADYAVYRRPTAQWFIKQSSNGSVVVTAWARSCQAAWILRRWWRL